ncbi:MAG: hypothetical protein V3V74_05920 [Nitrosomonadaceae bacterium]
MKFSLLAVALVAIALTACDRPKQAMPEGIEEYGTRTEAGTTVAEERAAAGPVSEIADPEKFKMDNVMQAEEAAEVAAAAAAEEDEYSGKAVLPGHNLDGNGNPITDGKDPTKLMH